MLNYGNANKRTTVGNEMSSTYYTPAMTTPLDVNGGEKTESDSYDKTWRFVPPANTRWQGVQSRIFILEFVGTLFLTLSVFLTAASGGDFYRVAQVRAVLTGALVYVWYNYGRVSLAPQLSLAAWILGFTNWVRLLVDLVAQFGAAFIAAAISNAVIGNGAITIPTSTVLISVGQWWLIELLFGFLTTSISLWTIWGTARLNQEGYRRVFAGSKGSPANDQPSASILLGPEYKNHLPGPRSLALGAAVAIAFVTYGSCLVAGPLTGGSFNFLFFVPQVFFSDVANFTDQFLLFFFAPLVSGLLTALVLILIVYLTRSSIWQAALQPDELKESRLGDKDGNPKTLWEKMSSYELY